MLTKRIIPCLDVKDGQVVKGIQFKNHINVGSIVEMAKRYDYEGADELVFYDITASTTGDVVSEDWVNKIAKEISIPFCVAGGIKTLSDAKRILNAGADKISINSPALDNPSLIRKLANEFGSQCVVVGIDSKLVNGEYIVCGKTGDINTLYRSKYKTTDWVKIVEDQGAGEIVLNCMDQDGARNGYDILQLSLISNLVNIPLIASGGAGSMKNFKELFIHTNIHGALAASIFHKKEISIPDLKEYLFINKINIRRNNELT